VARIKEQTVRYLLERVLRKLARLLGFMIVSPEHYRALALHHAEQLQRGQQSVPEGAGKGEQTAAPTPTHGSALPPIPFPRLPGIGSDILSVHVVDVGAQPLSFEQDIYAPLVGAGPCHIVGFDPFADPGMGQLLGEKAAADESGRRGAKITILPYFIGTGSKATFHVNAFSPTSSLLPTNMRLLDEYVSLSEMCATKSTVDVATSKLDDVREIETCDFLKVDVQGGDFDVINHAARVLEGTLFVHIEAEFADIYTGQPLFSDIDSLLRRRDFQFIDFVKPGWNNYKALPSPLLNSRLLWADCIYMKNAESIAKKDLRLLLRAAYIAHVNYRKYDLSAHLIGIHDRYSGGALRNAYAAAVLPYLGQ
jgi:FkbM family methyltransferase